MDDVSSIGMYTPKVRGTGPDPESMFDKHSSPEPAREHPHNHSLGMGNQVGVPREMGQHSSQTNQRDVKVFDNVRFKNDILEVRKQQNAQEYGYIFNDEDDKASGVAQARSVAHPELQLAQTLDGAFPDGISSRGAQNHTDKEKFTINLAQAGAASMPYKPQTHDGENPAVPAKSVFANRRFSNQPVSSLQPRLQHLPKADSLETDLFNENMARVNPDWANNTEHVAINKPEFGPIVSHGSSDVATPKTDNQSPSFKAGPSLGRGNTFATKPSIEFGRDEIKNFSIDFREDVPQLAEQRTDNLSAVDFKEILKKQQVPTNKMLESIGDLNSPNQKQYPKAELLPEPP